MKRMITTVAAAAIMATSGQALDTSEIYGGAGLALESLSSADAGVALVLNGGLPVMEAGEVGPGTVAVEGEFTYSLVDPSWNWYHYDYDVTVMTLAGYAAYIYDIDSEFYVKPRVGLIYRSYDMDYAGYGGFDDSEIGLSLGVGGGYHLNSQMDIYADFTMLDGSDLTHLTAGIVYKF